MPFAVPYSGSFVPVAGPPLGVFVAAPPTAVAAYDSTAASLGLTPRGQVVRHHASGVQPTILPGDRVVHLPDGRIAVLRTCRVYPG